jgi:putative spermidine/putrescine transport system substrate-binding protein
MRAIHRLDQLVLSGARLADASRMTPSLSHANPRIVVGTFGGDYARLLTQNIETPLLAAQGWRAVQHQADDARRRAALLAERTQTPGSSDLQRLSAAFMHEMNDAGVLEPLDYDRIPTPVICART